MSSVCGPNEAQTATGLPASGGRREWLTTLWRDLLLPRVPACLVSAIAGSIRPVVAGAAMSFGKHDRG
jgi:hypothetical protein